MTKGWGRPFEDPIKVDGRKLVTLRDAGEYIAALPKREHDAPEWQAAMEALILAAANVNRIRKRPWVPTEGPSSCHAEEAERESHGTRWSACFSETSLNRYLFFWQQWSLV
jgi:hypothetical protein